GAIRAPGLAATERRSYRDLSPAEGLPQGAVWARAAIIDWKSETRLPLLKQALMVLRPKDNFYEASGRVSKYVAGAKLVDMPDQDKRLLEGNAALVAKHMVPFLA